MSLSEGTIRPDTPNHLVRWDYSPADVTSDSGAARETRHDRDMTQNEADRLRELEESAEGVEVSSTPGGEFHIQEARDEAEATSPNRPALHRARRRRVQLHEAMSALERDAARPTFSDEWLGVLQGSVSDLIDSLEAHTGEVEGDEGLLALIREDSPRLAAEIGEIEGEHVVLADAAARLLRAVESGDTERIRRRVTSLLGRITTHRQRGADLVYEAYSVDIGASG